jgi:hypothetical protein
VAPARRGGFAVAFLRQPASEKRDAQPVDPRAQIGEQRRQQRHRGEHHHQHGQRGRDRHPVHVGEAGEEEAEDRDHDRAAGDDHAPPGGGHRLDHCIVPVFAVSQRGPEAGQHEQRVIDPDSDADQAGDREGPVRDRDDVGEQRDQPTAGDAEPDDRDRQWQTGGDHGAEGDQQDDRAAGEADPLRAGPFLGPVDRIAAELDLEPADAVVLGRGDELFAVLFGDLPAGHGQGQRRGRDRAVVGDADRRRRLHVLDLRGLVEKGVDAFFRCRPHRPVLVLPDDEHFLAGVPAELPFGDLARRLRLRAGGVVVGFVLASVREAEPDDQDRRGDPGSHHAAAIAVGDVSEASETTGHRRTSHLRLVE